MFATPLLALLFQLPCAINPKIIMEQILQILLHICDFWSLMNLWTKPTAPLLPFLHAHARPCCASMLPRPSPSSMPPCHHVYRLRPCCHPHSSPPWCAVTLHWQLFHEGQHQLMLRGEKGGTEPGKCMFTSLHLATHGCHDPLMVFRHPMSRPPPFPLDPSPRRCIPPMILPAP